MARYLKDSSLVSICIITRNRRGLLSKLLRSLEVLTYRPLEVIVTDNGSEDDTLEMLGSEFPDVRVIALGRNAGIVARNEGMRAASGDFILTLDDDVTMVEPDTIEVLLDTFARQPKVGLICLKICDPDNLTDHSQENWWYPLPREAYQNRSLYSVTFNEAAAMFRKSVVDRSGLYFEPMFWGGEERDLALRILDAGAEILYLGSRSVVHWGPRGMLPKKADSRHRLLVRNALMTAMLRLPWLSAVKEMLPRLGVWGIRALRYGYLKYYCLGLWDAFRAIPLCWRHRSPISRATLARTQAIKSGRYWDGTVSPCEDGLDRVVATTGL